MIPAPVPAGPVAAITPIAAQPLSFIESVRNERESLLRAVSTYEIIESYPENKYLPSYLVLCRSDEEAAHVQLATDVEGDNIRIVTVYRPSPREWEPDLRTRRKNP